MLWEVAAGEEREGEEGKEEEMVRLFVAVIAPNLICNSDQLVGLSAIANGAWRKKIPQISFLSVCQLNKTKPS